MRDNVVWGFIVNFIFFIGLSYAGAIIAGVLHLLKCPGQTHCKAGANDDGNFWSIGNFLYFLSFIMRGPLRQVMAFVCLSKNTIAHDMGCNGRG